MTNSKSDQPARLLPEGVSLDEARRLIEQFRKGESLETAQLFLLLLCLTSADAQQELAVSDEERGQLKAALQPGLSQ